MKKYPKIYHHNKGLFGCHCFAFDKLDGSNIRVEWNPKLSKKTNFTNGFVKFGTRNKMITNMHHPFSEAVELFEDNYSEQLNKIFKDEKYYRNAKKITVYFEYHGENSFAGLHEKSDEKRLTLIDLERYQKGFIEPKEFLKQFSHLDIPDIIYEGEYNQDLIDSVRNNDYNLSEGVICKGMDNQKHWMVKIKTTEWIYRVKDKMGIDYVREDFNFDETLIKEI